MRINLRNSSKNSVLRMFVSFWINNKAEKKARFLKFYCINGKLKNRRKFVIFGQILINIIYRYVCFGL